VKIAAIAKAIGATLPLAQEAPGIEISGVAAPEDADEHSITFIADPTYRHAVATSKASVVIVKKGQGLDGKICLEVADPYCAFAKAGQLFEDTRPLFDGPVHPLACVHPSARIHGSVFIGPFSVVGEDCAIDEGSVVGALCVIENQTRIGKSCRIDSGAIVRRGCVLGNNVIIQSNAVIGSEGFGNAKDGDAWVRIPSFGNVVIEDGVEIGANTTIDRGTLGQTVIHRGVKIDNLVQIAHNVTIDENTAVAAQTGFAGSMKIGKRVMVGGQVGFAGHFEVGDDAFIGAQAGVSKTVEKGAHVTGYPARDLMTMRRIEAAQQRLPELVKEVKRLRKELESLKDRENGRRQG
jgi:UDP-3-O-[3-hydroxymyristoyl] glucosamine N-acyltransferase